MKKIETLAEWINNARDQLARIDADSPALDAQVLASFVLERSRTWVLAHSDTLLSVQETAAFDELLQKRLNYFPLPYILGKWEFFNLEFMVSPAVLIPRPETELLVEEALHWLKNHSDRREIFETATGSGCISISLAVNRPDLKIIAGDFSLDALTIAMRNSIKHQTYTSINFFQGNLANAIQHRFDLICANLPYIPSCKIPTLQVSRFEPRLALDGGQDGLDLITKFLRDCPRLLNPHGLVLLEIEAGQAESVLNLANSVFPGSNSKVISDFAGNPRLLSIES
ncbi:MAG: peptide chain release factor N(5)-glutamine methyltransferase [Anaerolineae bacterium]|nr:peptide chain release factor N(5)-glutamine methyltransferase [Anaerolineae bacterium]